MTDDDSGAPDGAPPKLTIGQRLLTALPNLQREPAPPTRPSRPTGTRSPAGVGGDDADGAVAQDSDVADEADTASTDGAVNGAGTGLGALLRGSMSKPGTPRAKRPGEDLQTLSREEIAHRIKRLDDRERFLALSAAPLGVAVGIGLTLVTVHLNPAPGNAKHVADSTIYLEGGARILLSGIVVAAALTRRRSFVGFALLFLGTSMGAPLFALPFWGLGGYLIWRVFKYQRALNAKGATTRRAGGGGRVPANPRAAGRAGAAAARQRAQAQRRRSRKEPAPTGPTPSKRYTPPRPTRPRPPAPPS